MLSVERTINPTVYNSLLEPQSGFGDRLSLIPSKLFDENGTAVLKGVNIVVHY